MSTAIGPSLELHVVDDATSQIVTDPYTITANLAGPANYRQALRNGTATFSDMPSGMYSLTTDIPYGYVQLDLLNLVIDGPRSYSLRLRSIADDVGIVEVLVEGQGAVPRGGTIDVPRQGISLRVRGKYQSATSPWPAQNDIFVHTLDGSLAGFGVEESQDQNARLLGPNDWEFVFSGWKPCSILPGGQLSCSAVSGGFSLSLYRAAAPAGARALRIKVQAWPLNYRLASDCCSRSE